MNRRPLPIIALVAALAGVGLIALLIGLSGAGSGSVPSPGANGSSGVAGSASPSTAVADSPPPPSASPVAAPSAAATCSAGTQLVALRAVAPDTGFPVPVRWTDLGPAGDLFFTLSDVSPTVPIAPAGPASLTVGLSYMTGGDRFAFTAGSGTLTYDPATGRVSGDVDTGYGKNSNRASTDASPSRFEGSLTRPTGGANGLLTGSIAHAARTFEFRVEMTEKTIATASGPGCPSTRPTDTA